MMAATETDVSKIKETAWRKVGKYWTSHYNWIPEIRAKAHPVANVRIHDCTLRDGEQAPGIALNPAEKVHIAKALDEMGIHRIEAGMPVVTPDDTKAFKEIVGLGLKSEIWGFGRTYKPDIDAVADCGGKGMIMEFTEPRGGYPSLEAATKAVTEAVEYGKGRGLKATIFITDTTRREMPVLEALWTAAVNGKADGIALVDTFAGAVPDTMYYLVKKAKEFTKNKNPIEVHCHNRLGMGIANVLASLDAGAEVVHTNINGVNGQTALHHAVVNIIALGGIDLPGVKVDKLYELSKWFEVASRKPIADEEMVIGRTAFTSSHSVPAQPPYLRSYINPVWVGRVPDMALGKMSGRACIKYKIEELKLPVPADEKIEALTNKVKQYHCDTKDLLSDDVFRKMYKETV